MEFLLGSGLRAPLAAGQIVSRDNSDRGRVAGPAIEHQCQIVIALVGMAFEAKIAAGPGVLVACRSDQHEPAALVESAAQQGCRGIISFGLAGGLASDRHTGDWVVASAVLEKQIIHQTDAAWSRKLLEAIVRASYAPIMGVDAPISQPTMKRELHRTSGAAAVDMESHVVARLASRHGLGFAAVRVIVDPADRAIPPAALRGMAPNGDADISSVLRDLSK